MSFAYQIKYSVDGVNYEGKSSFLDIKEEEKNGVFSLVLLPSKKIKLISSRVYLDEKMKLSDKFFENGYQSWTDTKEQSYFEKTKKMGFLGKMKKLEDTYHFAAYGDYNFIEYHRHYSFSFTYLKDKKDVCRFYGSTSEKEGYTVFYINKGKLEAYKDNKDLVISAPYTVFSIFSHQGSKEECFIKYASCFNKSLICKDKITGFTTWYRHYQNISEETVNCDLENVKNSKIPFEYFQIDDGYEPYIGDWTIPDKKKFPNGLEPVIKHIKDSGYKPGIWLAPFLVDKDSDVFKKHPNWCLKDVDGKYMIHGSNWGGSYILDIYNPEVREHLHNVFSYLKGIGIELFKLDFLYAVSNKPREDKSRGQIMCEAMEFLREELKGKIILSCGVPLFPCFFNVDYCRIGTDVSLIYNDVFYMRFCHRERISTKLSMQNTISRFPLDHLFFLNDPDVILMVGTKMSKKQKKKLYQIDKKYGSVYFTSDDVSQYKNTELSQWEDLKR